MAFDIRFLTLATVIERYPGWVPVLEQFGIDGRGGVEIMLGAAADRVGVDVETIAISLAEPQPSRWNCNNIADAPVRALIEHIADVHHALLWRELPRLTAMIASARASQPDDNSLLAVEEGFNALREDLEQHLHLEESSLFPMCNRIVEAYSWPSSYTGPLDHPIEQLRHDHDHAHRFLVGLSGMLARVDTTRDSEEVGELIAVFDEMRLDLDQHLVEENTILFPKVLALVSELDAS